MTVGNVMEYVSISIRLKDISCKDAMRLVEWLECELGDSIYSGYVELVRLGI